MNYEVRFAQPSDIVWMVEVAGVRMLEEEVKRPDFVNRKALYDLADRSIDNETALICWKGEEPVGLLGWLVSSNPFNPDLLVAAEILWYVLPEHRGTRAGYLLMKGFSEWLDKYNILGTMSLLSSSEVSSGSLERFGFKQTEYQFMKG